MGELGCADGFRPEGVAARLIEPASLAVARYDLLVHFFASGEVLGSQSDGTRSCCYLEVGDLHHHQRARDQRASHRREEAYALDPGVFPDRPDLPPDTF